jgi:hypothetical protein
LKPKQLLLKPLNIFRFAGSKTAGLESPAVFVCGIDFSSGALRPLASLAEMLKPRRWCAVYDLDITLRL